MPRATASKERRLYIVQRLAEMEANDPRRRETVDLGVHADVPILVPTETRGPMTKEEAQQMGAAIADADGNADIYEEGTDQLVAMVRWGALQSPDQRNEKGERLFFDPENCFWAGVSRK